MGRTTFWLLEQEQKAKEKQKEQEQEEKQLEPKKTDLEEKVNQYYTGGGWYDLPSFEKALRKEEAIKALLKESDN